ncbi:Glucose-6-phosphate isomerase [bioreactor metagenome]|uniref:glucose-6-phosphate isomerase n=1 Tax=bioreactor metagenome TaxID=1076179 RepID=A0A645IGW7_9ZZZZ
MGQFLQQGHQIFFETVINVEKPSRDIIIPESAGELLAGKSMNQVNKSAMEGVISAHATAGIPVVKIDIPELNAFYFGQMIYFFETTCAITAYLMEVNPFNQPGVEQYKEEMKRRLMEM